MKKLKINQSPEAKEKFKSYPRGIKSKMNRLRKLIIDTAKESESIQELEETLKWGEPSYIAKKGSTIRIDWKAKSPDQYAMYFQCTSKLVPTFKEVYGNLFKYQKSRAILFDLNEELPLNELKDCIAMALHYHSIKNQHRLGR